MGKKAINLALQGGGSHGAFTWGVLDYLMEDGRVDLQGISGTSAGAMNAVVLAQGFMDGGPDGARESLEQFWRKVSRLGMLSPLKRSPLNILTGNWDIGNSPIPLMFDLFSRFASPYDTNPFNFNPLRDLVERCLNVRN